MSKEMRQLDNSRKCFRKLFFFFSFVFPCVMHKRARRRVTSAASPRGPFFPLVDHASVAGQQPGQRRAWPQIRRDSYPGRPKGTRDSCSAWRQGHARRVPLSWCPDCGPESCVSIFFFLQYPNKRAKWYGTKKRKERKRKCNKTFHFPSVAHARY